MWHEQNSEEHGECPPPMSFRNFAINAPGDGQDITENLVISYQVPAATVSSWLLQGTNMILNPTNKDCVEVIGAQQYVTTPMKH